MKKILYLLLFLQSSYVCFGQETSETASKSAGSRSSVSIGTGINHPLNDGYKPGRSWALQGNVKISDNFGIAPTFGFESIVGAKKGRYNGYYYDESGHGVDLGYLSLSVKYHFNYHVFTIAGPSFYVGGESASSMGFGGTAGAGYDLLLDDHSSIELSILGHILPVYQKHVPVAGVRIAYKFSSKKLN